MAANIPLPENPQLVGPTNVEEILIPESQTIQHNDHTIMMDLETSIITNIIPETPTVRESIVPNIIV